MQRLNIPRDLYDEFYAEGILALWHAYKKYDAGKVEIGTFINYQIRFQINRFDPKKARHQEILELTVHEAIVQIDDGNRYSETGLPIVENCGIVLENDAFWEEVWKGLSVKRWKWVHYFVIANLSITEIMEIEKIW